MPRYRATVAYDGSRYFGFQRQADGIPTIQAALETALEPLNGGSGLVRVTGAGRTDAGVHAAGNVIAFDLDWRHEDDALLRALNATLPTEIALQDLAQAAPGFHPRFDARSRLYRYEVYEAPVRHPLHARTNWHIRGTQTHDAGRMNAAAALLLGEHDFATFGNPTQGESTTRNVFQSRWSAEPVSAGHADDPGAARWLIYTVEANGFLHHMVRVLVGALIDVGAGRWTVDQFVEAFAAKDRGRALQMAPPQGLMLLEVRY